MFTVWWSRGSGAPAPDETALSGPLSVTEAPVNVGGDAEFRWAWTAPTGAERVGSAHDRETGVRVVAWARVDNRDDLGAALGAARAPSAHGHASEWLLAAYLAWGTEAPTRIVGDYSVVVFDPRRRTLFAWRDAIGIRPLFYAEAGPSIALSTSLAALTGLPGVRTTTNDAWLVHHSLGLTLLHGSTPYTGIHRVPPGHWFRVGPHDVEQRDYHRFDTKSPWRERTDEIWVERLRDAFDRSIADRLPSDGPVAAEITAGLDSAGIVGRLAGGPTAAADRLHLFGIPLYSDPEELLRASAQQHRVASITMAPEWLEGETVEGPARINEALGYPYAHGMVGSMIPTYRSAQSLGAATLYSGHGGDQCVSNPGWSAVVEWLDRGDVRGALREVVAPGWKAPLRVIRRRQLWQTMSSVAPDDVRTVWLETGLRRDDLRAAGVPELLESAGASWRARTVNGGIVDDRGGLLTAVRGYLSRRAEECSTAAALYGVEYVWPLLDTRLMQQYLSAPTVEKFHGGWSRYLYRRTIAPTTPADVTWRPSKVPGGPPASVAGRQAPSTLPLDLDTLDPRVRRLLDPDVLACGEIGTPGSRARISKWRIREVDDWLQGDHGETGAGAGAT